MEETKTKNMKSKEKTTSDTPKPVKKQKSYLIKDPHSGEAISEGYGEYP